MHIFHNLSHTLENIKHFLLFVVVISFLSSCQTSFYLKPTVSGPQYDNYFNNGIPIAVSQEKNSSVYVYVYKNTNNEIDINLEILNNSTNSRFDFIPHQNIRMIGKRLDRNKQIDFVVYNPETYLKKMQNRQNLALALQAVSASMEAQNAGTSTSTTRTSTNVRGTAYTKSNTSGYVGNTYGSVNTNSTTNIYGTVNSNSTTTTYDQSKVDEANYRNRQELKETANQYQAIYNATEAGLLKIVTVFPNQKVSGAVRGKFNKKYSDEIVLQIQLGDDIHRFTFEVE